MARSMAKSGLLAKKRTIKYWIGQLHLWLGLGSGLVVFIVSLTGCLLVFQQEISEHWWRDKYFVTPVSAPYLPLSQLKEKAQAVLGAGRPIENIVICKAPDRSWEFMAYKANDTALTYFGAIEYYESVFIDPYTGMVKGTRDYRLDFFSIVKYVHWSLLLNTPYGQPIVGWSTLVFVLLLITGLALWWPRRWSKAYRERSFTIKWKARWRRVNYDLHNVAGFYSLLPALVIGLTGLVFSFRWFSALVYMTAAGTTAAPPQAIVRSVPPAAQRSGPGYPGVGGDSAAPMQPLDRAFEMAWGLLPAAKRIGISPAEGREGTIYVSGYARKDVYYGADVLQFDQYSGQLLHRRGDREKNAGERLIEMNYDIHVGAIGGLTGKIMAFIASLICASLPVTGLLVWLGKRKKKKPTGGAYSGSGSGIPA